MTSVVHYGIKQVLGAPIGIPLGTPLAGHSYVVNTPLPPTPGSGLRRAMNILLIMGVAVIIDVLLRICF